MVVARSREVIRKTVRDAVAALREQRRARQECIQDNRDRGGEPHAAPTKSRRRSDGGFDLCAECYDTKLAQKRRSTPDGAS